MDMPSKLDIVLPHNSLEIENNTLGLLVGKGDHLALELDYIVKSVSRQRDNQK